MGEDGAALSWQAGRSRPPRQGQQARVQTERLIGVRATYSPWKRSLAVRFKAIMRPVRPTPTKTFTTIAAIGTAGVLASLGSPAASARAPAPIPCLQCVKIRVGV